MRRPLAVLALVLALGALWPALQVAPDGGWVDLSWSGQDDAADEWLANPLPGPQNLVCVVAKTVGGCGSMATRSWGLWVMETPGPTARRYVRAAMNHSLSTEKPPMDGTVLASRQFGTLVYPDRIFQDTPHPCIYYRLRAGHYQLLTWSPAHPFPSWNPSPGWHCCVLGGPWHQLSEADFEMTAARE